MTRRSLEHTPRDPLDFTPVPRRKARADGWTPARQREFITMIAATGSARAAAEAVGLQVCGAYRLRNAPGGESFALAWDAAQLRGTGQVRDILIDHSLNGVPEPVFHAGKLVGEKRKYNHRSMMWLVEKGDRLREKRMEGAHVVLPEQLAETQREVNTMLTSWMRAIARDIATTPEKRAAWDVLVDMPPDWEELDALNAGEGVRLDEDGEPRNELPGRAHASSLALAAMVSPEKVFT